MTDEQMNDTKPPTKVPVTVITGFLGSGKTTLLNYILTADHGKRIAVIENEFGDQVGIEKLIAKDGKGGVVDMDDLFVEVSNGCICCAVKDDLVTTIERLLERRSKFDYILLETSGLADPGPIASVFWLDDELESSIYLDAIVTVVDTQNLEKNLATASQPSSSTSAIIANDDRTGKETLNEAYRQLAYADKIILNKRDLVTESQLNNIRRVVNEINPLVGTVTSEFSKVPLDEILDVAAFDPDNTRKRVEDLANIASNLDTHSDALSHAECNDDCNHSEHADVAEHFHDDSIQSVSIEFEGSLNLLEFNRWLGTLLWEPEEHENDQPSAQYFRVKGIVTVQESQMLHVVQGVHESFDVYETKQVASEADKVSRVVFIGRYLNRDKLLQGAKSCIASQNS